jgi:O-antigen ligase
MTVPGIPYLTVTKLVMFFGISGWCFARLFGEHPPLRVRNYIAWYYAFAVVALISSLLRSPDLGESIRQLIALFTLPLVAVFIADVVREERTVQRMISLLIVCGGMLGAVALFQYVTGGTGFSAIWFSTDKRIAAGQHNANELALLLLLLLPLPLFRFLHARRIGSASWNLAVVALLGAGILISQSRAGFVVAVFVVLATLPFVRAGRRKRIGGLILILFLSALAIPRTRARLATLVGYRPMTETDISGARYSVSRRVQALEVGLTLFSRHPVIGVGWGSFVAASREYNLAYKRLASAENTYLNVLVESGFVGMFFYTGFLLSLFGHFGRALRKRGAPESPRGTALSALFVGYFGFLVFNLFGTNLDDNLPWVLLGLFGALAGTFASPSAPAGEEARGGEIQAKDPGAA